MEPAVLTPLDSAAVHVSAPTASPKPSEASVSEPVAASAKSIQKLTETMAATFAAGRKKEASDQAVEVGDLWGQGSRGCDLMNSWKSYALAIQWNKDNTVAIERLNAAAQKLKQQGVGKYIGIKLPSEVSK